MKKFEKIQQAILDSTSQNQLVSAGAGSGKTTVMIQKIYNLIRNGQVKCDNLLVVTFTVLAAQEMKTRLIDKLIEELSICNDKDQILDLIEQVKNASIDTIDGFNSKTIKKYFYELNIAPNIEIVSNSCRDYFITKAMQKTINKFANSEALKVLIDLFGGNLRSVEPIKKLIIDCYENVINLEDYQQFLTQAKNEYLNPIKSELAVNAHICETVNRALKVIQQNYTAFANDLITLINGVEGSLNAIDVNLSFKTNLRALLNLALPKFSAQQIKDSSALYELKFALDEIENLKQDLQKNNINEDFEDKNIKIIEYFEYFLQIFDDFVKNYNEIKQKNNLIDFNDLNRLMLKLLQNQQIKQELQNKYQYIFVDEYQDVNPLQDKVISSLINQDTHIFTVGDVKQSIYGFRGASPEWFLDKYNQLKANPSFGNAFDMNVNFRSNPKILNFINTIFCNLMTENTSKINYKRDCIIEPKRDDIIDDKVKILLVKNESETTIAQGVYSVKNDNCKPQINATTKEAWLVAKTITELVGEEFYDANLKVKRKLTYKDFAILSRSEKDEAVTKLKQALKECNIPVKVANKLDIKNSEVIKLILSILKCVLCVADDVDYMAVALNCTSFDVDDIMRIRDTQKTFIQNLQDNCTDSKVGEIFDFILDIKKAQYVKNNSDLIRYILDHHKIRYMLLSKPNGQKELQLVEEFLSQLSQTENGINLMEFVAMVESNVNDPGDFDAQDNENCVTIQTIHKSKGLEYPVVIMYNTNKIFGYLLEHDNITFSEDIGLGFDYFDRVNRVKTYSLPKYAIKVKNSLKGYMEELRLLYVALTRAKNKLFITGQYSNKLFSEPISKNSYQNMILSCFENQLTEGENNFEFCDISFVSDISNNVVQNISKDKQIVYDYSDFTYPNQSKFSIPIKNTVTGLSSMQAEGKKFIINENFNQQVQYNTEENRIDAGINYHLALESLDYLSSYTKTTDYQNVNYDLIKLAHQKISALCHNAINICKEADFMMYVPYKDIVKSSEIEDKVLVQGVVDLLIEFKDKIIIVDYKFSKLPISVLKQKYEEQLKLYKQAVELAYNKKVEQMYIYSINTGELA